MRKKTLFAALGLSFMLAFAGCGSEGNTASRTGTNNKVNDVIQSQIDAESGKEGSSEQKNAQADDDNKTENQNGTQEGTGADEKNPNGSGDNDQNGTGDNGSDQSENGDSGENGNSSDQGQSGSAGSGSSDQGENGNTDQSGSGNPDSGENQTDPANPDVTDYSNAEPDLDNIDIDLTSLSPTMVYTEVYNMMMKPDDYLGKTVKMSGKNTIFVDDVTGKYYYACIIQDATACCSQGIEYCLAKEYNAPADYPEDQTDITVIGVFDTYYEDGYRYMTLRNSIRT